MRLAGLLADTKEITGGVLDGIWDLSEVLIHCMCVWVYPALLNCNIPLMT